MTGLYDHGLLSDHRYQAARRTCERSGEALHVPGSTGIEWRRTLAIFALVAFWAFVIGVVLRLTGAL